MPELKYQPVPHDHKAFLEKAKLREGFSEAHEKLELRYALLKQKLKARTRAGS